MCIIDGLWDSPISGFISFTGATWKDAIVLGVTAGPVRPTNCVCEAVSTTQTAPHTATAFAPAENGKRVSNRLPWQVAATSGYGKYQQKLAVTSGCKKWEKNTPKFSPTSTVA